MIALAAAPFYAGRGAVQDLFFILTLLALAQFWNMLAGFAGLVSVGQQAFVGLGAYALYGLVIRAGLDPLAALPLAGLAAGLLALPVAFLVFRLQGAYFAIGTWVTAEVFRLLLAQVKTLGGGTGTALPKAATNDAAFVHAVAEVLHMRPVVARDVAALWLAITRNAPPSTPDLAIEPELTLPPRSPRWLTTDVALLSLSYLAEGYLLFTFIDWLYIYLVEVSGFSLTAGGVVTSLPWIAAIVATPLGGVLSDFFSGAARATSS